jgi:hypothetical protein
MNRRDFLERFFLALSAALFALFGIRPDVEYDEIKRMAKQIVRDVNNDLRTFASILKEVYSNALIERLYYGNNPSLAMMGRR